jgi:hypothetical protein
VVPIESEISRPHLLPQDIDLHKLAVHFLGIHREQFVPPSVASNSTFNGEPICANQRPPASAPVSPPVVSAEIISGAERIPVTLNIPVDLSPSGLANLTHVLNTLVLQNPQVVHLGMNIETSTLDISSVAREASPDFLINQRYADLASVLAGAIPVISYISNFTGDTQEESRSIDDAKKLANESQDDLFSFNIRTVEAAMYSVAHEEYYFREFSVRTNDYANPTNEESRYGSDNEGPYLLVALHTDYATNFTTNEIEGLKKAYNYWQTNTDLLSVYLRTQLTNSGLANGIDGVTTDDIVKDFDKLFGNGLLYDPWTNKGSSFRPETLELRRKESSTFSADEIKDLSGIINQLRQQSDSVSAFLWRGLTPSDQKILTDYQPSEQILTKAERVILKALNKTILGPGIFTNKAFQNVPLRTETTNLAKQNPTGFNLTRLNRMLLEDAYPLDLSRNEKELSAEDMVLLNRMLIEDAAPQYRWKRKYASDFKVRPLMTLTRPNEHPPEFILTHLEYGGSRSKGKTEYYVGDGPDSSQDRTVFTMLSYLFQQATVSTQNLPVQQTIRLQ